MRKCKLNTFEGNFHEIMACDMHDPEKYLLVSMKMK